MEKNLVFGTICSHLLAEYSHELSCWKTSQQSLFGEAETWSDRLPNWGIVANGELYEAAVPSELPTDEPVGFVLPTPTTDQRRQRYKQGGRSTLCAILEGDMMLPTPCASDAWNTRDSRKRFNRPNTPEYNEKKANNPSCQNLYTAVTKMLPTPSANEHKYRLKGDTQASKCLEAMARKGTFGEKARLHPQFVEWMMGFPIGWTDLNP